MNTTSETVSAVDEVQFQTILNGIVEKIHASDSLLEVMPSIESDILSVLNAQRITVYQKSKNDREIISKYKSGTDIKEIRIPLSPNSIAGYTALSQSTLVIKNVYDNSELSGIHPKLKFEQSYDKLSGFLTSSILAIPIKFQSVLLGVLQVLNRRGGGEFSEEEKLRADKIATILGQKFRYEFHCTKSPFDYLVQTKKIKPEQLADLEKRAKKEGLKVSELLLRDGGITRFELGTSLESYYQVPFITFDPNLKVPRELLKGINDSYLLKQLWVPIEGDADKVVILMDDPSDATRIMEIQRTISSKEYVFKVGLPDDIRRFLGQNVTVGANDKNLHELVGKLQDENQEEHVENFETVDENAATVIQLVNKLILEAYEGRASDIHIEPGKGRANTSVRFRVDGLCRPHLSLPASHSQAVVSRIKIISGLDISERRKPQDGKCLLKFRGQPVELRVATIPTVNGEEVVMRILASSEPLPVEKMNFSKRNLEEIKTILQHPHGIFLVVGPTGSGKTTTLHSVLGHINTPEKKIWTAEDPVEITQPGLHQLQVAPKIGLTFAGALRAFLRADPDVIMIGEMRDQETAHAGVEASLTGHLVFSTLHTNSAAETIVRLLDLGLDPLSFADALLGVLAQRLVRTLCPKCKEAQPIKDDEVASLKAYYGEQHFDELKVEAGKTIIYKAKGCDHCSGSGYRGRTGIHELLVASDQVRQLVAKSASATEIRDAAMKEGTRTLMQDGIAKLISGVTDLTQIKRVAAC
jgi:type II secretory ATPase GspE/PulE/Tfp pilus assembly ATPase PilB-like protein